MDAVAGFFDEWVAGGLVVQLLCASFEDGLRRFVG
jgi:hypothetical protein